MEDHAKGEQRLVKMGQNRAKIPTLRRGMERRGRGTNKADHEETIFKKHKGHQERGDPASQGERTFSKEGVVSSKRYFRSGETS